MIGVVLMVRFRVWKLGVRVVILVVMMGRIGVCLGMVVFRVW